MTDKAQKSSKGLESFLSTKSQKAYHKSLSVQPIPINKSALELNEEEFAAVFGADTPRKRGSNLSRAISSVFGNTNKSAEIIHKSTKEKNPADRGHKRGASMDMNRNSVEPPKSLLQMMSSEEISIFKRKQIEAYEKQMQEHQLILNNKAFFYPTLRGKSVKEEISASTETDPSSSLFSGFDLLPSEWSLLSDRLVTHIFAHLSLRDLANCSRVCVQWSNQISKNLALWQEKFQQAVDAFPNFYQDDIWKVENPFQTQLFKSNQELRHFNLNQIVIQLTPSEAPPNGIESDGILTLHQSFTTTSKLIQKLIQRFEIPNIYSDSDPRVVGIQLRCCKCLIRVLEISRKEIDENTHNLVIAFARKNLLIPQRVSFIRLLGRAFSKNREPTEITPPKPETIVLHKAPEKKGTFGVDPFFDMWSNIREIAEQLTLIDYDLFVAIQPDELISQGYKSVSSESTALKNVINHFNQVSRWVADTVLKEVKVKNRAKVMAKFIKIAEFCKELNNYESMMAIISAFGDPAIHRLQFTKDLVPASTIKALGEMNEIMGANFKNYREVMKTMKHPCVPYLGCHIKDLITLAEASKMSSTNETINYERRLQYVHIIHQLKIHQHRPYTQLPLIPALRIHLNQLFSTVPKDEEGYAKFLFSLSLKREPRGAKKSDVL